MIKQETDFSQIRIIRISWLTDDILQFYANGMKSLMLDEYINWLRRNNGNLTNRYDFSDEQMIDSFDSRKNRVDFCSIGFSEGE